MSDEQNTEQAASLEDADELELKYQDALQASVERLYLRNKSADDIARILKMSREEAAERLHVMLLQYRNRAFALNESTARMGIARLLRASELRAEFYHNQIAKHNRAAKDNGEKAVVPQNLVDEIRKEEHTQWTIYKTVMTMRPFKARDAGRHAQQALNGAIAQGQKGLPDNAAQVLIDNPLSPAAQAAQERFHEMVQDADFSVQDDALLQDLDAALGT